MQPWGNNNSRIIEDECHQNSTGNNSSSIMNTILQTFSYEDLNHPTNLSLEEIFYGSRNKIDESKKTSPTADANSIRSAVSPTGSLSPLSDSLSLSDSQRLSFSKEGTLVAKIFQTPFITVKEELEKNEFENFFSSFSLNSPKDESSFFHSLAPPQPSFCSQNFAIEKDNLTQQRNSPRAPGVNIHLPDYNRSHLTSSFSSVSNDSRCTLATPRSDYYKSNRQSPVNEGWLSIGSLGSNFAPGATRNMNLTPYSNHSAELYPNRIMSPIGSCNQHFGPIGSSPHTITPSPPCNQHIGTAQANPVHGFSGSMEYIECLQSPVGSSNHIPSRFSDTDSTADHHFRSNTISSAGASISQPSPPAMHRRKSDAYSSNQNLYDLPVETRENIYYLAVSGYRQRNQLRAGCSFILTDPRTNSIIKQDAFIINQFHSCSVQPEYEALCEGLMYATTIGIMSIYIVTSSEFMYTHLKNPKPLTSDRSGNTSGTYPSIVNSLMLRVSGLFSEYFHFADVELISNDKAIREFNLAKYVLGQFHRLNNNGTSAAGPQSQRLGLGGGTSQNTVNNGSLLSNSKFSNNVNATLTFQNFRNPPRIAYNQSAIVSQPQSANTNADTSDNQSSNSTYRQGLYATQYGLNQQNGNVNFCQQKQQPNHIGNQSLLSGNLIEKTPLAPPNYEQSTQYSGSYVSGVNELLYQASQIYL